ncbi:hypothetical protein FN846DRAFT_354534 [Sphaerosporella brunnea]|uniref:PWWP domain-containing protein n=1 Tax=Sphaerosporella brunnea TaxID=1250544 RepID=A0A5J5EIP3_9PEZI|nr:hypothetical protein FN846DRAFT_354534 [Sphaerosporella brunnea]
MAEDAPTTRADEATKENAPADVPATVADAPAAQEKSADEGVESSDKKASEEVADKPAATTTPEQSGKANGAEKPAEGESAAAVAAPAKTPASKKGRPPPKSASKKKSLANLKKSKTVEAPDIKYEVGQHVMARMRSYPPWPAIILSKELLPDFLVNKSATGNTKALESLGDAAWNTQYPIFFMGTYEYSWIPATDLEPLSKEKLMAGASRKTKTLVEAFQEAADGFSLEDVKTIQEGNMEVDVDAEVEAEDEMEVDDEEDEEEPSSDDKPKKKSSQGKKRKKSESASDDEAESEKPTKTPKKAAAKAKTPKKAAKETPAKPKTPKTPANGVKAPAKKGAAAKEKATATATKKKATTATTKKKGTKSKETIESDSEAESSAKSSSKGPDDPRALTAEQQHQYILHRRHKLQKAFLNKENTPPEEKEISELSEYLDSLEQWEDMPADLIRATKIHKVLKGIMNVTFEIPQEEKYKFKARCEPLHAKWLETIRLATKDDTAAAKTDAGAPAKENGVNGESTAEKEKEEASAPAAEEEKKEEKEQKETATPSGNIKEVAMGDAPPVAASIEEKSTEEKSTEGEKEEAAVEASA